MRASWRVVALGFGTVRLGSDASEEAALGLEVWDLGLEENKDGSFGFKQWI